MNVLLSVIPIVTLVWMMTKKKSVPSHIALPLTALFVYVIHIAYFKTNFALLNSGLITGSLAVLTPITVIAGAVLFNRFQQLSGCQDIINKWLESITKNPIAQFMIIGFAFAFMIEGASGFGTPAAIAAPILIGLGYQPIKVVIAVLAFNSVPVSFGAVGTPTWFGFGSLGLSETVITEIGLKASVIHLFAGMIVPVMALLFVFEWKEVRKNIIFIYLTVFSCAIPMTLLSAVNYEFPSLIGGAIGFFISVFLASKGVGLSKDSVNLVEDYSTVIEKVPFKDVFKALLPTIVLILTLVVTRIQQLPLKNILRTDSILFEADLGFAKLNVTKAFKISLLDVLGTKEKEAYELLYAPALIPFFFTVFILLALYPKMNGKVGTMLKETFNQIKLPFLALLGGVIMVKFMLIGGDNSMVKIIGLALADATGSYWTIFASYLGSIGAFFSGSNTISNLIFGGVQQSIAQSTGLSVGTILAMQSVGGAMGNMTCINNIIAACSVSNVHNEEGNIMKRTAIPMITYGIIAAIVATFVFPLIF
ncbi:L-lactate permease [Gemella sp. GH3]|uniref:L-lactate permease n=1 Tax=unclassified Gemella TaxID=2624949 RepID=UPI0015D00101|nr:MULTISPECIES: L-lactate permease [unclassified Gemella]MBF0714192.1 L-lactate permease [Gemella sp. GH3.1]NYS51144.1 L-lactate permease [Gemella sp. GH3]